MLRVMDLTDEERIELERRWRQGESAARLDEEYRLKPGATRKYAWGHEWTRDESNDVMEAYESDVEIGRLSSKLSHINRLYKQALKEKVIADRLVDAMTDTIRAAKPVAPYKLKVDKLGQSRGEHRVVALLSDLHVGEVVSAAETNGLAEYDVDIFKARQQRWTDKVLELVSLRRERLHLPNLSVFMLGDIVSGDIHDELVESNAVNIVDQVVIAAREISKSLLALASHFEHIEVSGVAGNHGRMSRKPYYKGKQRRSWDTLIYQMVALILSEQANVTFHIPASFWTIRNVLGTKFLLLHGDGINSWSGIPWYGLERMYLRLQDLIGRDNVFDRAVLGHFHDPLMTERFIVNGSYKGGDEYAIGRLFVSGRPSQTMLYVHTEHGVVGTEIIYLDGAARKLEIVEDTWKFS